MQNHGGAVIFMFLCYISGLACGYFFNIEGIKIMGGIWLVIGCIISFLLIRRYNVSSEAIAGWVMFGIFFGSTFVLVNYDVWLSPLLR